METNLESLMEAESRRMAEALKTLEKILRAGRKSDSAIELPAVTDGRNTEE